jgi:hypothetical protein
MTIYILMLALITRYSNEHESYNLGEVGGVEGRGEARGKRDGEKHNTNN